MPAVFVGAPAPVFVDPSQGTPGAPSPTSGVMTVQGVTGMYPLSGLVGVTGPVAVNNFPTLQAVTGAVGVVGPVAVTGPVVVATGAIFQGRGTPGAPTGGVLTVQGATGGFSLNVSEIDNQTSSSYPDQSSYISGSASPTIDAFQNLQTRGTVLTDEGSQRDDFTGSSVTSSLGGTLVFTAGSNVVNGVGTSFTTQVVSTQYVKKTGDSETLYAQVSSVQSDTQLTLATPYGGTSGSSTGVVSNWKSTTPAGGSIAVANSVMTMTCGTTANDAGSLVSLGDYPPYSFQAYIAVSQRIVNQTLYVGFQDVAGSPTQQATVQFSGTNNTQVNFVTSFANTASDTQTTTITLPNGGTTNTYHTYKIDLSPNAATLSIDGVVVAVNTVHLPQPYTRLFVCVGFNNGSPAPSSSTLFQVDYTFFENVDRVQVDHDFQGEPLPVQVSNVSTTGTPSSVNAATGPRGILGPNPARKGATIFGETGMANMYVLLGPTGSVSLSSYTVQVVARAYYELPFNYQGPVSAIWSGVTGSARITELT